MTRRADTATVIVLGVAAGVFASMWSTRRPKG